MFDVNYTRQPANYVFTARHVPAGRAGTNGPVTLDGAMARTTGAQNGAGQIRFTAEINLTRAGAIDTLENMPWSPQDFYLNLHGVDHPGGVLRAQLQVPDQTTFFLNATPQEEVPPVTNVNASATSAVTLHFLRNAAGDVTSAAAVLNVHVRFQVDTRLTAMHVHDQVAGKTVR
jgi:hypothetical protein